MEPEFTPAAQRAIAEAGHWSGGEDSDELQAPALLLGLLAESECRAALMLARCGIDAPRVRRRWPALVRLESRPPARGRAEARSPSAAEAGTPAGRFSADVKASLAAACDRLIEYARPLPLATEHLLLGLAAAEHEVAVWLRERGIEAESLEEEIHHLYGHCPGPLPCDQAEPLDVSPEDGEPPTGQFLPEIAPQKSRLAPPHDPLEDARQEPEIAPQERGMARQEPEIARQEHVRVLRVVDAAANRAREGLRVVEDYVRFVLDDRHLTDRTKRLRHELTATLARIAVSHRLAARETRADVGTRLTTPSERRRDDTAAVLAANFTRLQEALRSLEEFGKLLDPDLAAALEQLRYRAYTLHRAVEITRTSLERLGRARLYVLIDGRSSPETFAALARSLVDAGVDVIQLRDKQLDDRRLLERARLLREATRSSDTLLIINDRPDLAALAGADGVHVGQEEVSVKDARSIIGPDALIGVSTHSIEQARQAVLDGANYLGAGPTFPSGTKRFERFPGLELLRAVAAEIRLPAFAIGGIDRRNLPQVLATGICRVAVSGAVTTASDPAAAANELLAALGGHP